MSQTTPSTGPRLPAGPPFRTVRTPGVPRAGRPATPPPDHADRALVLAVAVIAALVAVLVWQRDDEDDAVTEPTTTAAPVTRAATTDSDGGPHDCGPGARRHRDHRLPRRVPRRSASTTPSPPPCVRGRLRRLHRPGRGRAHAGRRPFGRGRGAPAGRRAGHDGVRAPAGRGRHLVGARVGDRRHLTRRAPRRATRHLAAHAHGQRPSPSRATSGSRCLRTAPASPSAPASSRAAAWSAFEARSSSRPRTPRAALSSSHPQRRGRPGVAAVTRVRFGQVRTAMGPSRPRGPRPLGPFGRAGPR